MQVNFISNQATSDGGALFLYSTSAVGTNLLFDGNSALNGGAVEVFINVPFDLTKVCGHC